MAEEQVPSVKIFPSDLLGPGCWRIVSFPSVTVAFCSTETDRDIIADALVKWERAGMAEGEEGRGEEARRDSEATESPP